MRIFRCLTIVIVLVGGIAVLAQAPIQLQAVVTAGLTSPVFVTNAGDGTGRLFIVQQNGIIKVLQPGSSTPTEYLDIRSQVYFTGDERGLLGLAFHPRFSTNRRFFVYYTRAGDWDIQIAEYQQNIANPNVANPSGSVIITIENTEFDNHNGGTVAFGSDGFLYAAPGDGGYANDPANHSQNIENLLGKMIRIDIDNVPPAQAQRYNIPPTNPYAGATPGRDEIYAIGLRNPYRFSFDRRPSGRLAANQGHWPLWLADVGQGALEEIDIITLGGNYGWRTYEGTNCTGLNPQQCAGGATPINHTPPIFQYSSSGDNNPRCSITGGYVYRGRRGTLPDGAYVYADFCTGEIFLYRGEAINTPPVVLLDTPRNIVGFGQDERGEIYVVSFASPSGTIHKIVPAAAASEGNVLRQRTNRR